MNRIEKPGIIYTHRDDDVHEFIFTGESEQSLDNFFNILKDLLSVTPPEATLRYLVDATTSTGRGAMTELIRRFRKLEVLFPVRATGRTAILHDDSIMLTLSNTLLDTFTPGNDRAHLFRRTEKHRAEQWLRDVVQV